ncbi:hypothetical protein [Nannocystis punicea]|uniref:Uncharacterized protein n=1 Tax=Nannocystis punicea TaxID=2995304 RepID=A0ABY7H6E1_9BACT|nr:hypothetical protein [Nannocystis poenicansa]WAS94844.1 hypothetical protein O0S08_01675 [Nannocystis poenicansa]
MSSQAHTTWRSASGSASWIYRPRAAANGGPGGDSLVSPEQRSRWISRVVATLPALLGSFARATDLEVSTRSKGEGALALEADEPGALERAREFIRQNGDVVEVCITLTLECEGLDLQPIEIDRGALLWIDVDLDDDGQLDPTTDDPIRLRLQLNADIHAPLSWGNVRDNTALAALNAGRLAGALERIELAVPAELIEIDAPDYPDMVDPRGFFVPRTT